MNMTAFVKNESGMYLADGAIHPDEIIQTAASILLGKLQGMESLTSPEDAVQFLRMSLSTKKNEHFAVLFLDTRHRVLGFEVLFNGTIDGAAVYPRVIVQKTLSCNAAAVILAHNHPSQDCEPSKADKDITSRIKDALQLIDVRVLDHLIVSTSNWVSLANRGYM